MAVVSASVQIEPRKSESHSFLRGVLPTVFRLDASGIAPVAMMAHETVIGFLYQSSLVRTGNAVARRLNAVPTARKIATRLACMTLIGFGIKLATNNR